MHPNTHLLLDRSPGSGQRRERRARLDWIRFTHSFSYACSTPIAQAGWLVDWLRNPFAAVHRYYRCALGKCGLKGGRAFCSDAQVGAYLNLKVSASGVECRPKQGKEDCNERAKRRSPL